MPRQPERPWYWAAQDVWVVQMGGRRVRLAKGRAEKRAAFEAFHRLMAERGRPATPEDPPVGYLVARYLGDLRIRRDRGETARQTKADAERRLAGFVELHGDLPASQLKPHHVKAWLETREGWGPTSRHDGVAAVKAVLRWATRDGLIDRNPLAELAIPPRKARREEIPDTVAAARALAAKMTPELADILAFIHATGCRPKEARDLEAKHLDLAAGVAILAEHKTARKTGKRRAIYLAGPATEIAARRAERFPSGPIFRNTRGEPWTKDALVHAIDRLRRRAGLGKEVVAYAFRHLFATDAAAGGTPAPILAELLGHADLRMIATYSHLGDRHDALREAAGKVRGRGEGD